MGMRSLVRHFSLLAAPPPWPPGLIQTHCVFVGSDPGAVAPGIDLREPSSQQEN